MDYTVKRGETLSEICKRFGVSEEDVLKLNRDITDPDNLRQDQVVTLPPPTVSWSLRCAVSYLPEPGSLLSGRLRLPVAFLLNG